MTDRLTEWRALAQQALSRTAGPGWVSSTYPRNVTGSLKALIEAEAECCPFLSFDVRERGDLIEMELRFPPEFEQMVSAVTGEVGAAAG